MVNQFPEKVEKDYHSFLYKILQKNLGFKLFFLQIVKTGLEITETKVEINKLKKFEVPVITDEAFV